MPAKIVIGVDPSPRAADALALGAALAAPLEAELVVATVRPLIRQPWLPGSDERDTRLKADALAVLDKARAVLGDRPQTSYESVGGYSPQEALHELAAKLSANVLVVAQTHRGSVRRVAGVAEHLLHGASCAVGVAPPGLGDRAPASIERVAAAFDGSPESAAAVGQAAAIAKAAGAKLRVVGVFDTLNVAWVGLDREAVDRDFADSLIAEMRSEMEAAIEHHSAGTEVESDVIEGPPADTLIDVSRATDLLVCGSRGLGPIGATLVGSVSNRLVHSAESAVLAIPDGTSVLRA